MISVEIAPIAAYGIITDPRMYGEMVDDYSPAREDYMIHQDYVYLTAYVDGNPAGFCSIQPLSTICGQLHFGVLPEYRKQSFAIGQAVLDWIWENTNSLKLLAQAHTDHVKRFCMRLGFNVEGTNEQSFIKNGELIDQTYLGLRKCQTQ